MSEADPVPQEVQGFPETPEPRGFPWIRLLAGLMLVAVAGAVVLWLRQPEALQLAARFDPPNPAAGSRARLFLKVSPTPAVADGLLQKVRAEVTPPRELVFDRNGEYLLPGEEEMILSFVVDKGAAPGPRRLMVRVTAELPAGAHRSVARTVDLHRKLELVVAPAPVPATGGPGKN